MAIKFKDAVKKMSTDPKAKYFFFFCEKGENGKPVVLADTKKIDPKKNEAAKEVLASAKSKGNSSGSMQMVGGTLSLKPTGGAVNKGKLETGFKIAAGNDKVLNLFQGVKVGEPEVDEEDRADENEQGRQKEGQDDFYTTKSVPPSEEVANNAYLYQVQPTEQVANNAYLNQNQPPERQDPAPVEKKKPWRLDKQEVQRLKALTVTTKDDPLAKADPVMGKLLEKKREAAQELASLLKDPNVTENELKPTVAKLEQINEALETAQRKLNKLGVAPKALGREYQDEDKKYGWRAGKKPERGNLSEQEYEKKLKEWEEKEKSDTTVTRYHSEDERQQSELIVDDQGTVRDRSGQAVEGAHGYVMDPEGKKLHKFKENERQTVTAQRNTGQEPEEFQQEQRTHHSSVRAGKDVAGAGGLVFKAGKIVSISNASGHYKPGTAQLIQTVEELLKQGALLDKTYLMLNPATGKGEPLTGKPRELYEKSLVIQDQLEKQAAEARVLQDHINHQQQRVEGLADPQGKPLNGKEETFRREVEELDELVAQKLDLDKKLKTALTSVTEARNLLEKLGAGPANKFAAATVQNLDINEKMTGADVHNAKGAAPTSSVEEFVTTGGGNRQLAEAKRSMQEELLAKTKGKRAQLDQVAEKVAARLKPYLDRVAQKTLPRLQEQLAFALKLPDPEGKEAAARLQKVITSYESQAKSRQTPTEDSLNRAIQNLDNLEEKLQVLETVSEQLEKENSQSNSYTINYAQTANELDVGEINYHN